MSAALPDQGLRSPPLLSTQDAVLQRNADIFYHLRDYLAKSAIAPLED